MERGADDRGVSEVIGFILVFGMLVTAFTVYQGIVVPDQNRQVEFEHNKEVQGQFQDLRNAIVSTSATGSGQAVSVTLGATYPTRAIAQNLGVSGGSIQTTEGGTIRIDNAEALDDETADYLDGDVRSFATKSIRYTPVYSFYSGAPNTVYENTLAFNQFDGANVTLTDQVLVDGRRITLVSINGSLSKAQQDTVSISTEAISASSNRVAVKNRSSGPINVTIPTTLPTSKWNETLADEDASVGGFVRDVTAVPGEDAVNLTMEPGVTYELRMAKVGVGDVTADEPAKYVTTVEGNGTSVGEGGTQKLVVEVRDRFNNPVSNVTVTPQITQSAGADSVSPVSEVTDSRGRATFTYTAPSSVNGVTAAAVEVSFPPNADANQSATFQLEVLDSDGSGGTGGGGGAGGGGQSRWSPTNNNQTFSQTNGVWTGIDRIQRIVVDNGVMVTKTGPINPDDKLSLEFNVYNDTQSYTLRLLFLDRNQDGDFTDGPDVRDVEIYDGSGSDFFEEDLSESAAQRIIDDDDSTEVDLLDIANYDLGGGFSGDQSDLDRLKLNDAAWLTNTMEGRVDVRIEST